MTKMLVSYPVLAAMAALSLAAGCARQQPVTMAPPMTQAAPPMMNQNMGGPQAGAPTGQTFSWQDVPVGQEVPITRAVFDQGGYQLYAQSGETIVVPFANQNMYVMKFGISNGGTTYFVNDGQAPTLYVPRGASLENAAAQGARWYPFAQDYNYSRPVYVGIAPSWSAYTSMGWYPGMSYYGGYWGYNPWSPGIGFSPMPGLYFNIGGHPYYGWNSYSSYYRSNPYNRVYVTSRPSYSYNSVGRNRSGSFGTSFGRSASGSSGSFGRTSGSSGSFGRTTGGTTGSLGRSVGNTGSFGRSSSGTSSFGRSSSGSSGSFGRSTNNFGTSTNRSTGGSFGSSSGSTGSTGTSSFGSGRRSSFGTGSSGFGSSTSGSGSSRGSFGSGSSSGFGGSSVGRSSGSSSFGSSSGRSSGSSFGSGRSSFGGGGRRR